MDRAAGTKTSSERASWECWEVPTLARACASTGTARRDRQVLLRRPEQEGADVAKGGGGDPAESRLKIEIFAIR